MLFCPNFERLRIIRTRALMQPTKPERKIKCVCPPLFQYSKKMHAKMSDAWEQKKKYTPQIKSEILFACSVRQSPVKKRVVRIHLTAGNRGMQPETQWFHGRFVMVGRHRPKQMQFWGRNCERKSCASDALYVRKQPKGEWTRRRLNLDIQVELRTGF